MAMLNMENKAKQLAFETLFDHLPVTFYWMDKNGYLQGCNERALEVINFSSIKECIGKHITEFANPDAWENSKQVIKDKLPLTFEETHYNPDGTKVEFLSMKSPIIDEVTQEIIGVVGVSIDITERKKREKILAIEGKAKQLAFEALFLHLPITFYWMDKAGYLKGCNEKLLKDLKLSSLQDYVGKHITDMSSEETWKNCQQVVQSRNPSVYEETHYNEGALPITYLSIKSPLLNEETNECEGVVGIAIDITDRKKMEEALRIAKEKAEAANIAKSEFIANMAHDLRTPFGGILSINDFLYGKETDPLKKDLLGDATISAKRLLELFNQILDVIALDHHQQIEKETFNLKQSLIEVEELSRAQLRQKKLKFNIDCPEFSIHTDKLKLNRIILNLVGNAIKFTKKGGITIQVKNANPLEISISDTGLGIPEDKLDAIFEPFTLLEASYNQSTFKGSGLGLHIVKKFAEELGGTIKVESRLGKGSCFTLRLPN